MADYNVNKDMLNVSSTLDFKTEPVKKIDWTVRDMETEFGVSELIDTLYLIEKFKRKYPGDETFTNFEECVRAELCGMFGGKLIDE